MGDIGNGFRLAGLTPEEPSVCNVIDLVSFSSKKKEDLEEPQTRFLTEKTDVIPVLSTFSAQRLK